MGIRNLTGYMHKINAFYKINIKDEIEKHQAKYNKKPIIIIDGVSIHSLVYTNNKEKLIGGRFHIYNDRTHKMFNIFIKLGCELIFVFGGPVFNDKIPTLIIPNQMNALAIISDDSDFLIFDGNWQFWNARDVDLDRLTITVYDKSALRSHLSLTSDQMILFATMSGNDFLKYDQVKYFHRKFSPTKYSTFLTIAKFVREVKSSPYNLHKDDEIFLLKLISNNYTKKEKLEDFRKSISFYCDAKYPTEKDTSELLIKASTCVFIYAMLVDLPTKFSLPYDLTSDEFRPGYQLIRPFNRRAMGIILKHKENEEILTRTFYAKPSKDENYKANIETPIFPDYDLPPLLELMTKPLGENDELDNLRMQLFCWYISPNSKLTPDIILNLPEEHVIVLLNIYVLVEQNQVCIDEADCLLFANVAETSVKSDIKLNLINRIMGRDLRITSLFTRFFLITCQSLKILGLKCYKRLISFDGLYYHYLRQNWENPEFKNDLNNLYETYKGLRIYAKDF